MVRTRIGSAAFLRNPSAAIRRLPLPLRLNPKRLAEAHLHVTPHVLIGGSLHQTPYGTKPVHPEDSGQTRVHQEEKTLLSHVFLLEHI